MRSRSCLRAICNSFVFAALRREVEKEFGNVARVASRAGGPVLLWTVRREELRLAAGRTYEPPTFLERSNWGGAVTS